eukprot:m.924316 g.924316  ORF g.924316 m.924316 type:complete len:526 (+) comp23768_c0_seq4:366-1943(+)
MAESTIDRPPRVEQLMDKVELLLEGSHPDAAHIADIEEIIDTILVRYRADGSCGTLTDVDQSIIAYARYMLAVAYLAQGMSNKADLHLLPLGMAWRLSSSIWVPKTLQVTPACTIFPQGNVRTWNQCLPPAVVCALKEQLRPSSTYWSTHGYDSAQAKFFSYHYNLKQQPSLLIERCVKHLQKRFLEMQVPEIQDAVAVEWWTHKRPIRSSWMYNAHQLHFDTDEHTFQKDSRVALRHPLWSCVVYLSDAGGPTLVTDKAAGAPGLGEMGALVMPQTGRCVLYRGNLLHGVIPHLDTTCKLDTAATQSRHSTGKSAPPCGDRVTLIVAWWGKEVDKGRDNVGGIGPMQQLPRDNLEEVAWARDLDAQWESLPAHVFDQHFPIAVDVGAVARRVAPLWERIDRPCKRLRTTSPPATKLTMAAHALPHNACTESTANNTLVMSPPSKTHGQARGSDTSHAVTTPDPADSTAAPTHDGSDLPQLRFFVSSEDAFERIYEAAAVEVFWEHALLESDPAAPIASSASTCG